MEQIALRKRRRARAPPIAASCLLQKQRLPSHALAAKKLHFLNDTSFFGFTAALAACLAGKLAGLS